MKISVITITYNSSETIKKNLESVLFQTYKDIEHIIVDGGSDDQTLSIINNISNDKLKVSKLNIRGIYKSFNEALKMVSGDYFCFLNSDDYLQNNNVIENLIKKISVKKNYIYYGDINYVNSKDKVVRKWKSGNYNKFKLNLGWVPPHTGTFFSSKLLNKGLNFNENYDISSDYDFILKSINLSNHNLNYLNFFVTNMRLGGISNKPTMYIKVFIEDYKITKSYFNFPLFTTFMKKIRKIHQFIN